MLSDRSDVFAGILKLRAKAAEQLTGNEYYMIVQQLDALASRPELADDVAQSVLSQIDARLGASANGGPEIPSPPSSPAQPEIPSMPEEPVTPDSPAQPDGAPTPEILPPPPSPAETPTPRESGMNAGQSPHIITPRAGSFGGGGATGSINLSGVSGETEAAPVGLTAAASALAPASGLQAAVEGLRGFLESRLTGNGYYQAANLLGQLQILPPADAQAEQMAAPETFDDALTLLRHEAGRLSGLAHEEAARAIAALDAILTPNTAPSAAAEMPLAKPAAEPRIDLADAPDPEPDPGPRTGFDALADASWQRVKDMAQAAREPGSRLNGRAGPDSAVPPAAAPQPIPATPAAVQPMAQDIGEAFNDGGSESRSSEPCYAAEFAPAAEEPAAPSHPEPTVEAEAGIAPEATGEAAIAPETESVAGIEARPAPVEEQPEAEVPQSEPESEDAQMAPVAAPEDVAPADAEPPLAEARPAASAEADSAPPAHLEPKPRFPKAAKKGLFGRLFGNRSASFDDAGHGPI